MTKRNPEADESYDGRRRPYKEPESTIRCPNCDVMSLVCCPDGSRMCAVCKLSEPSDEQQRAEQRARDEADYGTERDP